MNVGRTVFAQLLDHLLSYEFQKCVTRYRGDYQQKTFSCWGCRRELGMWITMHGSVCGGTRRGGRLPVARFPSQIGVLRIRLARHPPVAIGARLTQLPGEMAKEWTVTGELAHWETGPSQYRAELKSVEEKLGDLYPTAENSNVETHLVSLGRRTTLRLIIHGYLMAREAFAVAFYNAHPRATKVDKPFFESLLD